MQQTKWQLAAIFVCFFLWIYAWGFRKNYAQAYSILPHSNIQVADKGAQNGKVLLVLSGGGAKALAHIGVLKYLEERNVRIDYAGGASMGALVAALYAGGYSAEEIKHIFTNPDLGWDKGRFPARYDYNGFVFNWDNTSFLDFKMPHLRSVVNFIPTNFIRPEPLFLGIMDYLGAQQAHAEGSFNNLFVPFRCYAVEVGSHEKYTFQQGNIGSAILASMAYPFYLPPQKIGKRTFLDGGIYDNFPVESMREAFRPTHVIGSSTSLDPEETSDNHSFTQLIRLIKKEEADSFFSSRKRNMVMVKHENIAYNYSTFDFDDASVIIEQGYKNVLEQDSFIRYLPKRSPDSLFQKRVHYTHSVPPLLFTKLKVAVPYKWQQRYLESLLKIRRPVWRMPHFIHYFSKVFADERLNNFSFSIQRNPRDSAYHTLLIDNYEFLRHGINAGGGIMAGPIGSVYNLFLGYAYNYFVFHTLMQTKMDLNISNFHNYVELAQRIDIPRPFPYFLQLKSSVFATNFYNWQSVFTAVNGLNFLTERGYTGEVSLNIPIARKFIVKAGGSSQEQLFSYYNSGIIRSDRDSTDQANINHTSIFAQCEYNTLNHKLYPSEGTFFSVKASYNFVKENTHYQSALPANMLQLKKGLERTDFFPYHLIDIRLTKYLSISDNLQMGFSLQGVFSNIQLRNDYYTSLALMPRFTATQEMHYLFRNEYMSPSFINAGIKFVLKPIRKVPQISLHLEGYMLYKKYNFIVEDNLITPFAQQTPWKISFDMLTSPILSSIFVWSNKYIPLAFHAHYYARNIFNIVKEIFEPGRVHIYFSMAYVLNYRRRNFYQ